MIEDKVPIALGGRADFAFTVGSLHPESLFDAGLGIGLGAASGTLPRGSHGIDKLVERAVPLAFAPAELEAADPAGNRRAARQLTSCLEDVAALVTDTVVCW